MATLYVGSSQDYQTIQDAVNAANDGDTIIVKGSEYALTNEKVSITKAVTVQAEGDVTVDQFGIGSGAAKPQDIVIDGFTIKPTVCAINAARTCGIYQNGTNLNTLTVTNCNFDLTEPAAETTGYGIHLDLNFSGTEKVTVDGCTFTGDDAMVTSAMRASYQSSIEFTNNTVSNISGHAVQMSLTGPTWGYDGDAAVTFEGNTFTDIGACAIYAADIANNNVFFNVTENDFTNINVNGGSTYWGAIRFGSGSVNGLTVKDNTIVNGNVGIYQGVALKDGAEGTIEISGNNFILSDRPGYSASALNVYDSTTGTVNAGDFSGNEFVVLEGATSILVDAALTGNEGDVVSLNGKNYIIGVNAFANLTDAVNAASATEETTITVASGTYADNVTLDSRTMEQKGDIKFIGAEGAEVTFTGLFTLGYYEKRVGSQKWDADVTFENITFDQALEETHSIDIQQVNDFTMTNCTVIGDGEYGILGTNVDNGAVISDCNFETAGIQSAGNFGTNLLISGGVFEDSKINIQSGNSVTIDGVTFNSTLTDADVDNSFYVVRSNSIAINITNCTFNLDSSVTGVAEGQEEWAMLWARNATDIPWSISNIEINLTDAAMAQVSLDVVKNGKTAEQNTPDRITINGIISSANDVADLIAKTDGYVNVIDNGTYTIYNNGEVVSTYTTDEIFVDAAYNKDAVGEGMLFGFNAFNSFTEALKAVNETTGEIVISGEIAEDIPAEELVVSLSKNLTVTGAEGSSITLNNGGYKALVFGAAEGAEDISVNFSGVNLTAGKTQIIFGNTTTDEEGNLVALPVNAEIDATSTVSAYVIAVEENSTVNVLEGGRFFSTGEVMNIKNGATLSASGSEDFDTTAELTADDRQVIAHYMWNYGTVELTDTVASIYSQLRLRGENAKIVTDNAVISLGMKVDGTWLGNASANGVGWTNVDGGSSITLTNNSVLKANGATGKDGYGLTLNEGAEFNIESGSSAEFSAGISNAGEINIDNGTLKIGTEFMGTSTQPPALDLVNNGTVNVSGKSTISGTISGNRLTFAENTTLVDSNINYTGSDSFRFDGVTFEGDNTINSGAYATSGMSFTVAEGGSLKATGARWTLGGTGIWNINGTIENARELTAEEKAELTASLDVNGLSLSTGGGEAVMNVTNAYFTYGSGHITTKNTNSTGGKIVMNFTNSVVESAYKYSVNPTKAGYDAANAPEVVLNVTGSVFKINNYFTNNHAKGTVNVDNSDLTATAFGNVGTFSAVNGSVVNFSLVNNALGDWAGKGSLNAGSMLIDDSTLNIVNKTASLEFYNVGEITLANGAVFTLDRLVNAQANNLTGSGNINTTFADMTGNITISGDSQLTVSTLFTNDGTITVDAGSTITAAAITNNGTITINAKGYTGDTIKVIDLSQDTKLTGVKLTNASNKYYLTYGEDGDVILNKSPEYIYVSSDYNSSTEGYGYDKFSNYDSAVAFAKNNAPKATIVMEKTTTISGNCVKDKSEDLGVDMTNTLVIQDGAVMGNSQSKWDMTYAVTIEAGGILQSGRPASAGYGNIHIKNKLTIGEADSEKRAEIRFINGESGITYKTMSIALLSAINRSITANNALIEVGDLGLLAKASFTDTELVIDGILAAKGTGTYSTVFTDSTVTIKGHNLMNENTYYSTVGTILGNVTMDNTSMVIDDGVEATAAEKVWLGYTANTAQTLTLTNGSSITVEEGTLVELGNSVSVTDSEITVGTLDASATVPTNSSFYFNSLEKGKVYYAVIYDAEGNEIETIERTSTSGSTFYPKFSALPAGDYKAVCYADEAKTQIHQEKTYSFKAQGTMELVNSDLTVEKMLLSDGNITMDIDSTIAFSAFEGGYITVTNADSYVDNEGVADGTYKLFDYTGTAAMTEDDYKALLNGEWHDNYLLLDNDLYLTDQEVGTLYVNSAWAGMEIGEATAEGYLYGFNAAATLEEIGGMIATDGSDTTVKFESDITTGTVEFNYGAGDITFTADKAVTVKQNALGSDWAFVVGDVDNTITIGENVTFEVYDNASGLYVYYGAGLNVEGTVTGGQNWGCLYLAFGDHTVASTGTVSVGRVHQAWSTLTVNGDAESDRTDAHLDNNYLLVEESTFTANNAIINVGAVHDSNNGGLRYGASEFNINDSDFTANTVTLKHADTEFTVTGESKINIGILTGAITLDNAALTYSAISKGTVNFKGDNTFAGDFNASYAFVGDWNNEEYDGSVDFGTESNVNVNGQMIIGYDTLVAGANNVVFGDVTGETVTDKVFKAADVSVRRDGTLTIANTTGENKISTMNVMGSVVIDNAKLSGEVQIGNNSDDIDAVMTVQNGAEVTLGGSSNSVVILGKSNGGILNVDDAEVVVKRAGAGAGYKVPADTFVIGYQGGKGELNVYNNGKFSTADYNGDKDGGMMNVELNTGSVINVTDGGSVEVSGNVNNSGKITVDGGSLSAAGMDVQAQLRITGLTKGEARTIKVSLIKEGETSGTIVELDVAANATEAVLYLTEYADGNYSATVIDGTSTFNTAVEVVNGVLTVADGTLDIAGTLALNMSKLNVSGESTLNIGTLSGTAYAADGTTLVDSNVGGTVVMEGDLAIEGDSAVKTIKSTVGGTLSIEEGKTLALNNFSFGSADNADAEYTITGGKVTANYGFFQHGTYTLDADFETGYMYYSYGSDITVNGTFHSKGAGDGLDYVRGKLTIAEEGKTIHDASLWIGQPETWGAMNASMIVEGMAKANSISVYAGSSLSVNGGTVEAVTVKNTGDFNVAGDVTLNIGTFTGVLTVNGDTVFSADTAVTVNGSVNADGYTVTMKQGAILGADSFTADKLILTDVVLPTDAAITVYAGATDIDKLVINGSNVTDGRAVIDGVAYDVVTDETGITMSESVTDYTAMTVKPTGVKQAKDSYTFTVTVDVTGGEGDYTYQIIDEFGNVLADGLEFTVSGTPESSILNIGVKVFDTYGETTAVITAPIFVPVRDYTAPVFNSISASTTEETKRSVILTADFSDNFDAAVADNLTITYSVDGGKSWKEYTDGAKITANGTVIFKATDAEGNSTTAEYVVDNIVTEADYDKNGLADTLFVHDNKLTSAWFTDAADTEITLTDIGTMDDNMDLLGSGRIYGSANDGSDIFYTDGTTVKAWDVQDGAIAGTTDVWKIDANREILGLGDFNGDGATDLLIKSQYGDVGAIYAGAESKTTWNYFSSLGSEWKLTGIGDFNGDGVDDVALFNTRDGNAGCWISQEDGSVLWTALDKIPGGEILGAGDFNGDGVDDVLIRKGDWVGAWIVEDGRAKELLGLGNITATVEQIADFNGDGISDLRVRDGNMIGVITVDADGKTQWKEFVGVGDEWKSSNVGIIA